MTSIKDDNNPSAPIKFSAETHEVIEQQKLKIDEAFISRRQAVIAIGKAIENENLVDQSKICSIIKKYILQEEIKKGLITGRDIERHCLPQWKKKTRPKGSTTAAAVVIKKIDKLSISSGSMVATTTTTTTSMASEKQEEEERQKQQQKQPILSASATPHSQDTSDAVSISADAGDMGKKDLVMVSSLPEHEMKKNGSSNSGDIATTEEGAAKTSSNLEQLVVVPRDMFEVLKDAMGKCMDEILIKIDPATFRAKDVYQDMDMSGIDPREYLAAKYLTKAPAKKD